MSGTYTWNDWKIRENPLEFVPPSCMDKRTKELSPPVWIRMH